MEHFLGALPDTRTEEEKQKDFLHEEIASATPLDWSEKKWKTYPIKYQFYTSECVAQSTTKFLGINEKKERGTYQDLSPEFFYSYRVNKPGGGMVKVDAGEIATTRGSCLSEKIPQRHRETEPEIVPTDDMIKEAVKYRGFSYVTLQNRTIDTIAEVIEQQGACLLWFWFDVAGKEWWTKKPHIIDPHLGTYDAGATRHALCAVDYGMKDGEKVIVIEDSAGNDSAEDSQRRYINAEFLTRCFEAWYIIDFIEAPVPSKPSSLFLHTMKYGDKNDDVKRLQEVLQYLGYFPSNVTPTGLYGGITSKAVEKFQIKSGIYPTAPNNVGLKTILALAQIQ